MENWTPEAVFFKCSVSNDFCEKGAAYLRVFTVVHFTVVCLVTWPMNELEAGVDL